MDTRYSDILTIAAGGASYKIRMVDLPRQPWTSELLGPGLTCQRRNLALPVSLTQIERPAREHRVDVRRWSNLARSLGPRNRIERERRSRRQGKGRDVKAWMDGMGDGR